MRFTRRAAVAAAAGCTLVFAAAAEAVPMLSGSDAVQPKVAGNAVPVTLMRGLEKVPVAQGSDRMDGGTAANPYYGYDGDGPMVPAPGDLPTSTHLVEATKTEPDKNTYLVLNGQNGADPAYDYGTHFLFQGHEARLPAPALHHAHQPRRRRGAPGHAAGEQGRRRRRRCPTIDGSTWDPFAQRLLFTTESGDAAAASTRRRWTTRPGGTRHLRRVRPRRLRGRPERLGRQHLARRGRRRRDRHRQPERQAAEQLRLPLRPEQPGPTCRRGASCRCCR